MAFSVYPFRVSLYPGEGNRLLLKDLRYLPVGPSWYSAMQLAYLSTVMANHDLASFALTERPLWNVHGHSYFWQRFFLGKADITSPEGPGRPIIHIPFFLPKEMQNVSAKAHGGQTEGWYFLLPEITQNFFQSQYSFVATVDGFPFFGSGIFDREPPQLWGAPKEKRKFYPSHEILAEFVQGKNRFIIENIMHQRNFVTTPKAEFSQRHSFFWHRQENLFTLVAGLEYLNRTQDGAEWGENFDFSQKQDRYASLALFHLREWIWDFSSAFGYSWAKKSPFSQSLVRPIEDEVNNRHLEYATKSEAYFWDNHLSLQIPTGIFFIEEIKPFYHFRFEGVLEKTKENLIVARSYAKNPLDVGFLKEGHFFQRNLLSQKMGSLATLSRESFELQYHIAFLTEYLYSEEKNYLRLAFLLGVQSQIYLNNKSTSFFMSLRQDVPPLTQNEARFFVGYDLWERYLWNDANQNGIFENSEATSLLPRYGGKVTEAKGAKPPYYYEAVLGFRQIFKNYWQLISRLNYRYYRSLYQIRYAYDFAQEYMPLTNPEVEGQLIYNRIDNYIGLERYVVTNDPKGAQYFSWEWQVLREFTKEKGFFSFSIGAYLNIGYPPPGNGLVNDISSLSYQTADPNGRLNLFGRLDYDRGYMIRLLHGWPLGKNFTLTNSLLYRDGIPVGKVRLVDGISQGPQLTQYSSRGGGLTGVGRYVFYMQWDIRLLYENPAQFWYAAFDIYNVNNFSLELKEKHYFNQDYRAPSESMVGRTIRINIGVRF